MGKNRKTGTKTEESSWLQFYKSTQGYWTRVGTAIGGSALILWGATWLIRKLDVYRGVEYGQYIQIGSAVLWTLVFGFLLYWLAGRNPRTVDFLISVEGEMKKVNWSTWPEVVGATKIVIFFTILTSFILFLVDTGFMLFFSTIGILKATSIGDVLKSLFGS